MKDELLEIDVGLLILRYGRQRVLQALASLGEQTPAQLQQRLVAAERKRKANIRRPPPSIITDLVASESRGREEIAEPLRALAIEFQNRTFLPQLRDVQRFLDRIGVPHGKLKSRKDATSALVRALAKLTREDLLQLAARGKGGESDYSLLARAIMGTPPKRREGD